MQSSYAETFPLSEDIDLGNTWDALGVPSEEETARFDNPAYWPLSTIDAAQPYVEETFLKTQTSLQFDLNPQRTPQDSPLTSPLGTPSSGFPPSSYTPTLSSVSSGSPVPVTPPISITISESPQSLSPAFPVRHSREQYRLNPGLLIESILPRSADPSLRLHLYNILSSDWWYKNEREPRKEFVPFIKKHAAGGQRQFECLLCGKKVPRSDRAGDHIRTHIYHRPYRCEAARGCGDQNCQMAFYTNDCLKSHRSKNEQRCGTCGTIVEDKNLNRHQKTQKCRRAARLSA